MVCFLVETRRDRVAMWVGGWVGGGWARTLCHVCVPSHPCRVRACACWTSMASLLLDPEELERLSLGLPGVVQDDDNADAQDDGGTASTGLLLLTPDELSSADREDPLTLSASPPIPATRPRPLPSMEVQLKEAAETLRRNGRTTGDRPNLMCAWVQDELLEKHPRFEALPPIATLKANTTDSGSRWPWLSLFSQSSPQAADLHNGRITTRNLAAALGLFETTNGRASKLAVPSSRSGPKAATHAYSHIQGFSVETVDYAYLGEMGLIGADLVVVPAGHAARAGIGRFQDDDGLFCDRPQLEAPHAAWKVDPAYGTGGAAGEVGCLTLCAQPLLGAHVMHEDVRPGTRLVLYTNSCQSKGKTWELRPVDPKTGATLLVSTMHGYAATVQTDGAQRGKVVALPIQGPRGSAQQHWFPECVAEDGALRLVTQGLGSDGDGPHMLAVVLPGQDDSGDGAKQAADPSNPWWDRCPTTGEWRVRPGYPPLRAGRPIQSRFKHAGEVAMGWGGVQEGVGLLAAMDVFPDATLKEVGCLLLELCPEHNVLPGGFRPSQLPLVGASPDGVLLRQNGDVEIVEVKCVCPYTSNGGGGGRGRGRGRGRGGASGRGHAFKVVDKSTPDDVPPYHVPQLQMEMLCAGARRGWYVYVSATRGVRIFAVERDDAYLAKLLGLLASFRDNGGRRSFGAEHDAFATMTQDVAKQAWEYAHVLPSELQTTNRDGKPGGRWFQ